jgi:hypothetical protein
VAPGVTAAENEGSLDMAFVRWRGRCCELIATVYENGRSKKIILTKLPEFYVAEWIKKEVADRFPGIKVDWLAVNQVLAQGPPAILTKSTPPEHLDMATIEHYLRQWANGAANTNHQKEADCLRVAANILTEMRAEFYWTNT